MKEVEDVFEAIRSFDPGNPLLNLKDKKNIQGRLIRDLTKGTAPLDTLWI